MECETCGGTDFYKELGYFYCTECQTQSQDVRDVAFQDETVKENAKVIKTPKNHQNDNKNNTKLTSWECYNVVIYSLTEQLIDLGAAKHLKPIVKCLWFKYLEKLEVLDLDSNRKPKLPLINTKKDVEILYGKPKPKKRRRTKSLDSTVSGSVASKRERTRRKTALAKAEYEHFSLNATLESTSFQNETLTSLKGTSDVSSTTDNSLEYSHYSINEMEKHETVSDKYKRGIYFLSPIKIYSILYLGLLINKDNIQLGDLFRYMREGHLNFNKYTDFFPDTYSSQFLNIRNNSKIDVFSSKKFRETTAQIAVLLDVTSYIAVPNLVELCQRYCKEMNLPDKLFQLVKIFISRTVPQLRIAKKCKIIPNYEGRAMSMILFVLKLLFGLDGVTEFHFANYAQSLNERLQSDMFNVIKWLEYIGYRSLLMDKYHLPSSQLNGSEVNSDLLLSYIKSHVIKFENDIYLTKEMRQHKELLTKIKDMQHNYSSCNVKFPISQMPFLNYSKVLLESDLIKHGCASTILKYDFSSNSVDYLLYPNKYLQLLNPNMKLKNAGANDNWIIEEIKSYTFINKLHKEQLDLVAVEVAKSKGDKHLKIIKKTKDNNQNPACVQRNYYEHQKHVFEKNASYVEKISGRVEISTSQILKSEISYDTHYNPYERYWMYLLNVAKLSKADIDNYVKDYPVTLKLLFNECTRIIEQDSKEFYAEFQDSELFLVYFAIYNEKHETSKRKPKKYLSENFDYYVKQAKSHW